MAELVWIIPEEPPKHTIRWEWPMAIYKGQMMKHAAYILCEQQFHSKYMREEAPSELGVVICRYIYHLNGEPDKKPFHRMLSSERFKELRPAIEFAQLTIDQHVDWQPRII